MGKQSGEMFRNVMWLVVGIVLFTFPYWAIPLMGEYLKSTGRESAIFIVERATPGTPTTLLTRVAGAIFITVAVYFEVRRRNTKRP
jgi:hypothetical protein